VEKAGLEPANNLYRYMDIIAMLTYVKCALSI